MMGQFSTGSIDEQYTMPTNQNKIWFRAKTYGWGLPCSWQGWVVMVGFLTLVCGGAFLIESEISLGVWITSVVILTAILIIICFLKGEKPRWRWGKE
jgi:hypothetical protein